MHISTWIISFIYLLNLILMLVIVFRGRQNTAQTWAWILVLTFLPVIGFPLYIFFGRKLSSNVFDVPDDKKIGVVDELQIQQKALQENKFDVPEISGLSIKQLIYMMTVDGGSLYTKGNHVDLYIDGIDKFDHLMKDIEQAQDHVHLEYFAYEDKKLGQALLDKLVDAAKRGVKVKLMIDGWGSIGTNNKFFKPLIDAGGELTRFAPYLTQFNYRNHRKIAVIDGKIAYIGGFNIGDEYLGLNPHMGYWRDNHLRIEGPAVYSLQSRFLMDWNSQHKKDHREEYQMEYFPEMVNKGENDIQIIASGPDSQREQIKMVYVKMINMAEEEILIQTPYYIPDDSIHEALKSALLSGVKVRLQIPDKPDHILIYWATYSLAAELVEYGASVEIYKNGFIHAKTMIIDGKIASVGSANIDIRSFRLNFEINSVIYNQSFAEELRHQFDLVSTQCQVLTMEQYENRGRLIKIKEGLARLVQPLL